MRPSNRRLILVVLMAAIVTGCGASGGHFSSVVPPVAQVPTAISRSPQSVPVPPMQGLTGTRPAMSLRKPQSEISALTFTQLPGAAVYVAASPDGTFWVLSTQGLLNGDKYIYHYVNGTYVNVPGAASRIAVGPDDTPWVVNAAGGIYHLVNGLFQGIAGGASEISVGGTASAPLVDVISNQSPGPYGAGIYQYNVNAGTWSQLPGAGVTVAASIDSGTYPALDINPGGFYVTNQLGGIFYYNLGVGFEQLPGGAVRLAPTANGGIFALGDPTNPVQHGIYYNVLSTGQWTQMPGAAVSISANSQDVYAIGAAGGIYVSPITSAGLPAVSALGGTNALSGSVAAKATAATLAIASVDYSVPPIPSPGSTAAPVELALSLSGGSGAAGSARAGTLAAAPADVAAPIAGGPYGPLDGRLPPAYPRRLSGTSPALPQRRSAQSIPPRGTQQSFYVEVAAIGTNTATYDSVPFTLIGASAHVAVWIESTDAAMYQSHWASLASDAETSLTSDEGYVGTAFYTANALSFQQRFAYCSSAGQENGTSGPLYIQPYTYINLLLVDPTELGAGVGGDFTPGDLYLQSAANCFGAMSNQTPTVTIGLSSSYTNLDYYIQQTTAHEFTHLIQFVNQQIILARNSTSAPGVIQEGLAELARDVVLGHPDYGNIAQNNGTYFLPAPQNYSILGMEGLEKGTFSRYTYGNYAAAYLLMRYIADRYGIGFASAYIQADPVTGTQSSLAALASSAGASSFPQLFGDFAAMLAANANGSPSLAPYDLTSFSLTGTYTGPNAFDSTYTYQLPGVSTASTIPYNTTAPIYPGGLSIIGTSGASGGTINVSDPTGSLGIEGDVVAR